MTDSALIAAAVREPEKYGAQLSDDEATAALNIIQAQMFPLEQEECLVTMLAASERVTARAAELRREAERLIARNAKAADRRDLATIDAIGVRRFEIHVEAQDLAREDREIRALLHRDRCGLKECPMCGPALVAVMEGR